MKFLSMTRLKAVAALALACAAAHADAADQANPSGFTYYGNGDGTFTTTGATYSGAGYTGAGYAGAGYAGAGYAPGMAGYGATPTMYAGYPGYGYGGAAYGGYGYGGYGYGGCDACAGGYGGRRRHCCSFGGNSTCCNNCWDGYCAGDGGYGGACGGHVKVHRRHRALGCGAGPCVDAACDTCAPPRRHHCHLRRRCAYGCGTVDYGYGYDGSVMSAPGAMYDGGYGQPNMAAPNGAEQLQSPAPTQNYNEEPQPMPGDDSST